MMASFLDERSVHDSGLVLGRKDGGLYTKGGVRLASKNVRQ